jgi:hypothetical protein
MQQSTHSNKPIHTPAESVSSEELTRRLAAENGELRQIVEGLKQALELKDKQIDESTNALSVLKELVQQLRDEIAILKGLNPKPKIKPSQLEGAKKKSNWHKRFRRWSEKENQIVFGFWVGVLPCRYAPSPLPSLKQISNLTNAFQVRAFEVSRLARSAIKNVRRVGKRGQPRGKPRKKKRN